MYGRNYSSCVAIHQNDPEVCDHFNPGHTYQAQEVFALNYVIDQYEFSEYAGIEPGLQSTVNESICPKGWRLPSKEEWGTFESVDGSLLKTNTGWVRGYAGVDMYDFSVLPAGCRYDDGDFADEGYDAYFWSSTEFAGRFAYGLTLDSDFDAVSLFDYSMDSGFSVRCLKD